MNDEQLQTIEQVKQFLGGSVALEFRANKTGAISKTPIPQEVWLSRGYVIG